MFDGSITYGAIMALVTTCGIVNLVLIGGLLIGMALVKGPKK
jgi:hypothetical protein